MRLFTSIGYLDKLMASNSTAWDLINLSKQQSHLQLVELLFYGINEVYLEDDDQTIEQSKNQLVRHYFRGKKIKWKKPNAVTDKPLFDLYFNESLNDVELKGSQKRTGCFHGNSRLAPEFLFGEYFQHFDTAESTTWDFATPMFEPHNSIVVVDPYLFTYHALQGLLSMFGKIVPKKLREQYHITLIGRRKKYDAHNNAVDSILPEIEIKDLLEELRLVLSSHGLQVTIEYFFCNQPEIHDRYIFTNNAAIFLGSGLSILTGDKPFKEGSWLAYRPYKKVVYNGTQVSFYYNVMQKKLKTISGWIHRTDYQNMQNPLLKF